MPDNPNRSFGFLIHDVARLQRKAFDRRAQDLGLSRAQWSVLANLYRHQGIKQATLAEILEIEPITLVRLIDRLESGGWVERRPDPSDRRVRRLHLTGKALPMIDRMQALAAEVRAEATAGLTADELEQMKAMLCRIKSNLLAMDAAAAAGDDKAAKTGTDA